MKKRIAAILSIAILFYSFTVHTFATKISGWHTSVTVNNEYVCLIKNEYYKKYHDDLFEKVYHDYVFQKERYKNINTQIDTDDNLMSMDEIFAKKIHDFFNSNSFDKIGYKLYNEMIVSEDTYYLNIYLNYTNNFSKGKNNEILNSINDIEEVLYVGNTTPCAVVAITGKNIDTLLNSTEIEFVNYAFSSIGYFPTSVIPENGNRTFSPDAAYARKILRYSAGLYNLSDLTYHSEIKEFLILSDTNLDGNITAADARTALRIAAGLEFGNVFTVNTDSFWSF